MKWYCEYTVEGKDDELNVDASSEASAKAKIRRHYGKGVSLKFHVVAPHTDLTHGTKGFFSHTSKDGVKLFHIKSDIAVSMDEVRKELTKKYGRGQVKRIWV